LDYLLDLEILSASAMCFKPVYLSLTDYAIRQSYGRCAFHLSPMARAVSALQIATNVHASADGNCLNILDLTQDFEFHPLLS
jgi:hypothetical protein